MSGNDGDKDGFPVDVFQQMQAGHEKFMRVHQEGQRFQQDLDKDTKTQPSPEPLPSGNDRNFFVSFKDFVDTNLNSLADSFRNLPSNIADLRAKMQEEREARKQEELDVWRRWTGIEDSPDHVQMVTERSTPGARREAMLAALMLLREARARNAHVPQEKIEALFKDSPAPGDLDTLATPMLSPGGACYYQPDSGYNAPSTVIWRSSKPSHRWLSIDWFKRSPYSPISLEHHPDLSQSGSMWRAAFEDLLNASLDKPMVSHEQIGQRVPHGKPQSTWTGPGLDWMLSLQCRGILPPQLPGLYTQNALQRPHKPTDQVRDNVHDEIEALHFFSKDHPYGLCPMLDADVDQLVDEIATPAPQHQYEQLEAQPETEQDLYQELFRNPALLPPSQEQLDDPAELDVVYEANRRLIQARREQEAGAEAARQTEQAWFKEQQRLDAEDELFDALAKTDVREATKCLNAWHRTYGSVDGLLQAVSFEPATKSFSALNEALRRSELPDHDPWKDLALEEVVFREQEMAERLEQEREALGLDAAEEQPKLVCMRPSSSEPEQNKVNVLSSLTTTRTTRLPDGTVTTKVVLKQRFADGREETEEKVHTYQEPSRQQQVQAKADDEKPLRKGWFWT